MTRHGAPPTTKKTYLGAHGDIWALKDVHDGGRIGNNGPMNKRELAKAVAVQTDVELKTVIGVIDGFTDVVTAVVAKGVPISIPGFAKFVKVDRPARMGRNPATGEAIRIKASKKARITPVKAFKDAVLAPAKAPKLVKGVYPTDDAAVAAAGKSAAPVAAKSPARSTPRRRRPQGRQPARRRQEDGQPARRRPRSPTGAQGPGQEVHSRAGRRPRGSRRGSAHARSRTTGGSAALGATS